MPRRRLSLTAMAIIAAATHRVMNRRENLLQSDLEKEFRTIYAEAAASLLGAAVLPSAIQAIKDQIRKEIGKHQQRVRQILQWRTDGTLTASATNLSRRLIAGGSLRLRKAVEDEDVSAAFRAFTSSWKRQRAGLIAEEVADTTATRIANAVARNLERGLTQEELRQDLLELGESTARASMIARTETHTAMMEAEGALTDQVSEQLGLKLNKTWIATSDDRTRQSHKDASGQTVASDELFKVGDVELRWPGDADGPPEEVINCRCVLAWDEA